MDDSNPKTLSFTPIKRLGLSRRFSPLASNSRAKLDQSPRVGSPAIENQLFESLLGASSSSPDPQTTPRRISNMAESKEGTLCKLKEKLMSVSDVEDLERVISLWYDGCKESLLALQSWISNNEGTNVTCKVLAQHLGIWNIICEHFQNDSDITLSDEEE